MAKYDTIVIGGGHNGLVPAAYLARGCAVTEEIWLGYRVSTRATSPA